MKPTDSDNMLWEMTRHSVEAAGQSATDDDLRAYRAGELDAEGVLRVEALLEGSAESRAQLARLAGLDPDFAPAGIRAELLDGSSTAGGSRTRRLRIAAAAVAAVLLGGVAYLAQAPETEAPSLAGSSFEIAVNGLAVARSGDLQAVAEAYPETRVTIRVEALDEFAPPFEIGLYRAQDRRLERAGAPLILETFQGAATLSGRALDYTQSEVPGEYMLVFAIAPLGELAASVERSPGDDPATTLEAAGYRVATRSLTQLAPRDAGQGKGEMR